MERRDWITFCNRKDGNLAKPNYQYEKRQRELAKKQKKEEKLRRKTAGEPTGGEQDAATEPTGAAPGESGAVTPAGGQGAG